MQAYCIKCRARRQMTGVKETTMKNGKPATQGICPLCGAKMFRIGKAQNPPRIQRFLRGLFSPQLRFGKSVDSGRK